mgnify:CR=1 FL=1
MLGQPPDSLDGAPMLYDVYVVSDTWRGQPHRHLRSDPDQGCAVCLMPHCLGTGDVLRIVQCCALGLHTLLLDLQPRCNHH